MEPEARLIAQIEALRGRVAQLERRLAARGQAEEAAKALAQVVQRLVATLDPAQAAKRVVSTVLQLFRVRRAVLYQLDRASGSLVCVTAAGEGDPGNWIGQALPVGAGVAGLAVAEGRPFCTRDLLTDPRITLPDWAGERLQKEGYRSAAGVPLTVRGEVIGALALADAIGRVFTTEEVGLLSVFADQAALALQNARLYGETRQRLEQTETLLAVSQSIGSTLDLAEVVRRTTREMVRALRADIGSAWRLSPSRDELVALAGYHLPKNLDPSSFTIPILPGHSLVEEVRRRRGPVYSSDSRRDPLFDYPLLRLLPHKSVLLHPMTVNDEIVGLFVIIWTRGAHRITPEELRLVEGISRQAAMALDNARLFSSQKEEAEVSAALLKLAEAVGSLQDLDQVLDTVVEIAPQLLGVKRCGLFRLEPTEGVFTPTKAWGLPEELQPAFLALRGSPEIPAVVKAAQNQEPVVVEGALLDAWIPRKVASALDIRSMLIIPLLSGGRLVGTMALDSPGEEHTFTPKQIAIARGIATHAAVAIDNARLYREAQGALADLKAAQEQIVRGETLRAIGEMASGMAHHLNNLLAVIVARVELLLQKVQDPEVRRSLDIVEGTARDGAEVVRRVRGFSAMEPASQMVAVDLNELAQDVVERTRLLWEAEAQVRGVEIQVALEPGDVPQVTGDPAALREVLMNLLLNAVDALREGGKITVKTWAADQWVCCSVADTGIGMSREVAHQALEPFFTTKGPRTRGLGLSVAYGILRCHAGDLMIESTEGRGTVVIIRLPPARA